MLLNEIINEVGMTKRAVKYYEEKSWYYFRHVLCRRLPKRSRKPPKPIGRLFTGNRRNLRSRKRGDRNG